MQIALVSDIHSNLVALEAVLEAMPPYDELWCLGDTIGYGPRPNECLTYMRDRATHVLTGNHDLASLGEISLANFNSLARDANLWNNKQLKPELRAYLSKRLARLDVEPEATLAHASPRDPIWEYILDSDTALDNLSYFRRQVCLVGHSHVPLIYAYDGKQQRSSSATPPAAEPHHIATGHTLYHQSRERRSATRWRSTRSVCHVGYRTRHGQLRASAL